MREGVEEVSKTDLKLDAAEFRRSCPFSFSNSLARARISFIDVIDTIPWSGFESSVTSELSDNASRRLVGAVVVGRSIVCCNAKGNFESPVFVGELKSCLNDLARNDDRGLSFNDFRCRYVDVSS